MSDDLQEETETSNSPGVVTQPVKVPERSSNIHRPSLSSASFRSVTSFASFRSSFKSVGSFRSVASRGTIGTSYHSFLGEGGQVNEAYQDCESYYSLPPEPPSLPSSSPEVVTGDRTKTNKPEPPTSRPHLHLGYLLLLISSALFTISALLLQLLLDGLNSPSPHLPWLLVLFRALVQLVVALPMLAVFRVSPVGPSGYRWPVYLTSLLSLFLTLSLHLASTRLLSPADLSSILLLSPPATLLLSYLLTREQLGLYRLTTSLLGLAGVLLLARPAFLVKNISVSLNNLFNMAQFNMIGLSVVLPNNTTTYSDNMTSLYSDLTTHSNIATQYPDPLGLVAALAAPLLSAGLLVINSQCRAGGVSVSVLLVWAGMGVGLASTIGLATLAERDTSDLMVAELSNISMGNLTENIATNVLVRPSPPILSNNTKFMHTALDLLTLLTASQWVMATISVLLGVIASSLSSLAMAWVKPGKAVLIRSSQILLMFGLQLVFVNSPYKPAWYDVSGAVIFTMAVLFVLVEDLVVDKERWPLF